MFNRMKSAFTSAVTGLDSTQSATSLNQINLAPKFPYGRPHFLNLNLTEEVPLSADHRVRPIVVPRERDALPWCAGYAECVNSGKSLKNEDQATVYQFRIHKRKEEDAQINPDYDERQDTIDVTYFGLFDGHAGSGAAVCAARQLHYIIQEKLVDIGSHIWASINYSGNERITRDDFIIGALERSFLEMDQVIAGDRDKYLPAGGCTALVAIILLDKVYVANAGDSRSLKINKDGTVLPLSFDYTPETEQNRIRKLAYLKPEILCGEYSVREYLFQFKPQDLGKQIFYRDPFMKGWSSKTITKEDLKMPVVTGEGKRSRVMNTIGVTRGFGDHDLRAINSKVLIKPLLLAHPDVQVLNLNTKLKDEDVLVMATDGLWDVTTNKKAGEICQRILSQFPTEKHRFISAAQALVAYARGKPFGETSWRTAEGKPGTGDDVSVFVIPLEAAKKFHSSYLEYVYEMETEMADEIEDENSDINVLDD